ncbi:DEAD/DEAH box helicase [Microlunatus sp. Gsoil 973]|uniref:DEAD/DEAH box helicase n=1 Tax=Microlunatus sp. Gsoil 973 TaxID=2672569 RepID=UPI0012B4D348|nr:DEAD/DEAH box helicase [Microlunatus sp. Gsoil 973]QGN35236.1 DEAD/DEAH box helicase [Microlunatus sp. Gsoil 973]
MRAATGLPPAFPNRAAWGTTKQLRAWQAAALEKYFADNPKDFLAVATPGAGKTSFALTLAANLFARRTIDRVVVVAPTEHLKTQWAEAADKINIPIDPNFGSKQGRTSKDFKGIALTYAGVAANPLALRIRVEGFKTLVILDEVHHAGDSMGWGDAVREAFEPATRRLALTGTPFRSDANPIPFVRYEPDGSGALRSVADYSYGYGPALQDGIVRPVLFMAYSGDMHWRTKAGDEVAARLGEPLTRDLTNQALRTALDPSGSWIPAVLTAADQRLTEVRQHVPDAGGLVIATDQTHARAYADILKSITGRKPVLVLSDEAQSGRRISKFAAGDDRWMVAVRMVSEGVDVPRLAVGVYATMTATPLFFAQAVGRFVRARAKGETASVFLPSAPHLLRYAADMEVERDHALKPRSEDEAQLLVEAERTENEPDADLDGEHSFAALASDADFDRVVFDGGEFGLGAYRGSDDELDYLGIPGLLEADQVKDLLRQHQARQVARGGAEPPESYSTHRRLRELRKELNGLVAAWHHRTGKPHGMIHAALVSECGGPPSAVAAEDQLQQRIDTIRQWAVSGT